MTRLVVLCVAVLAGLAVVDAVRKAGASEATGRETAPRSAIARLAPTRAHQFVAAGERLHDRILRNGEEYLSTAAIRNAFPVEVGGPIVIARVAVAPDGTLVLALYRFPSATPAQSALQFWRDRKPIGGFGVPPGYFGGGLAFNRDGSLVATFSSDGDLRGVFDREGNPQPGAQESFLVAG